MIICIIFSKNNKYIFRPARTAQDDPQHSRSLHGARVSNVSQHPRYQRLCASDALRDSEALGAGAILTKDPAINASVSV